MSVTETRNQFKSRVWQAIAESGLDLSGLSKEDQESLVNLLSDASLVEMDEQLSRLVAAQKAAQKAAAEPPAQSDESEETLWEGRPFLSLVTHYTITSERIRIEHGLLGKDREDIELIRVQDIGQRQTLRERLLNLGDLIIHSHDPSHPEVTLNNIQEPQEVHETLRRAVLNAREKRRLIYREEM